MAQKYSDIADEKGGSYLTYYIGGEILGSYLIAKGVDKVKGKVKDLRKDTQTIKKESAALSKVDEIVGALDSGKTISQLVSEGYQVSDIVEAVRQTSTLTPKNLLDELTATDDYCFDDSELLGIQNYSFLSVLNNYNCNIKLFGEINEKGIPFRYVNNFAIKKEVFCVLKKFNR